MSTRARQAAANSIAAAILPLVPVWSGEADMALEAHLRARHQEVQRWEARPIDVSASMRAPEAPIVSIGRVGPRTPVRFGDGRVRWYVVAGFRPAAVSTHAVERGASLNAADIRLEVRDVIGLGCEPIAIDGSQRLRAARRLAAGDALCAHNVERQPEVERDRAVTLSAVKGSVRVSRVMTAAADGRAGEQVRLRDRATGAIVTAIVTGPGAARIFEESP